MDENQEKTAEEPKENVPSNVQIRYSDLSDGRYLKQWLMHPDVGRWFPMFR